MKIYLSAIAMIAFLAFGLLTVDVMKSKLLIALSLVAALLLIQQMSKQPADNTKK